MSYTVSIVGLGKLGASMAAAMADRGLQIVGVDVNPRSVELINAGRAPVQETNLEETISRNASRIRATLSYQEAIAGSDVSFVIVPTPSDERGAFSLAYAAEAFTEIGKALSQMNDYHLVVLSSTVLPGATRCGLLPLLVRHSGKIPGRDFGLCYSPEFIALGNVIHDFLHPDFTLIGELDDRSGTVLEDLYAKVMPDDPPCKRMSIENAELTKIALNAFVTTKITFANMLAQVCEQLPGGDVDVVADALGADSRIGPKYLKGALGYGGPCFPRDNKALDFFARSVGVDMGLPGLTDSLNRGLVGTAVERLQRIVGPDTSVAVLGLAYKPHTPITEESQGLALALALAKSGMQVTAHDPLAGDALTEEQKTFFRIETNLAQCLSQADAVLVTSPDPAYQGLTSNDFPRRPLTVIDFWRLLDKELSGRDDITYIAVGRGGTDELCIKRLVDLWDIGG